MGGQKAARLVHMMAELMVAKMEYWKVDSSATQSVECLAALLVE